MIALIVVPVLVSIGLSLGADQLVLRVHPRASVPVLTGAAVSAALCTGAALGVCGMLTVAQLGPLPGMGQWSSASLRQQSEFPDYLGVMAMAMVAACASMTGVRGVRSVRELHCMSIAARALTPTGGRLVVIDDRGATAYAVPGAGGRVVVSTAMLKALDPSERRVLIAHEYAHLRGRHYVYRHLVRVAAAANPLLWPVVQAVDLGLERWADEAAVRETGDRSVAARALARAALVASPCRPVSVLAVDGGSVRSRVEALSRPPARFNPVVVVAVVAAVACCWLATGGLAVWGDTVVQHAEVVWEHAAAAGVTRGA